MKVAHATVEFDLLERNSPVRLLPAQDQQHTKASIV